MGEGGVSKMKRLIRTLRVGVAVLLGVLSSGLVQLYVAPAAQAAANKVIACHATGSTTNPFEAIKPDQASNHIDIATGLGTTGHPNDFAIYTNIDTSLNWGSIQKQLDEECAAENPATPITPAAPVVTVRCDANNDTFTITNTSEYASYSVNGTVVLSGAGTYTGTLSSTATSIVARALLNRTLTGTTTWSYVDHNTSCITNVTPQAPEISDTCGTANDSVTLPETTGVAYTQVTVGNVVTITARPVSAMYILEAGNGYTLNADGSATLRVTLTDVACPREATPLAATVKVDVCGIADDMFTIPATTGVTYHVNNTVIAAGDYAATDYLAEGSLNLVVTATANEGFVLKEGAAASWTLVFTNEACKKVTICHATDSASHPYVKITVNKNAADGHAGNSGNVADHYKHTGPIYFYGAENWGDIIPPIGDNAGLNWTDGEAILNADCLLVVTPSAPVANDFCYTDIDTVTLPETAGVAYYLNGNMSSDRSGETVRVSGTATVTAVVKTGYVLAEGAQTTWTFHLTNEQCVTIAKTGAAPVDTNHDGVISVGDLVTWTITLTNNGTKTIDTFDLTVIDEGATFEGSHIVKDLAPGESVSVNVTKPLTTQDMLVCKTSNTASFTVDNLAYGESASNTLLVGGQASATVTFTCPTPGHGNGGGNVQGDTTVVTTTAPLPERLPETGPADSSKGIFLVLIASTLAYGATFFLMNRREIQNHNA